MPARRHLQRALALPAEPLERPDRPDDVDKPWSQSGAILTKRLKRKYYGKLIYRAGQALIDPATPTEELARLTTPFLIPETPEETSGVNNVVFVEGLVAWRGEWLLHYGEGDAGVGVLHGRA
jgi:hypothetical protein